MAGDQRRGDATVGGAIGGIVRGARLAASVRPKDQTAAGGRLSTDFGLIRVVRRAASRSEPYGSRIRLHRLHPGRPRRLCRGGVGARCAPGLCSATASVNYLTPPDRSPQYPAGARRMGRNASFDEGRIIASAETDAIGGAVGEYSCRNWANYHRTVGCDGT